MAAKQGSTATKQQLSAAAAADFDPKFDWIDNAASYVLRLDLQGFKKDDFRVQVDSAGRLTVRGQRVLGGADAQPRSFHKVFQLPPASSLDNISGRFEAGVLTLTVPKRATASAGAAPPTTIEELKKQKPVAKDEGAAARKPPPKDQAVDGAKQQKDEGAAARKPPPKDQAVDGAKQQKNEGAAARKPPPKDQAVDGAKQQKDQGPAAPPPKDQAVDGAKQQKDDGAEKREATLTPAVLKPIAKDAELKKEESLKKAIDETARNVQHQQQQEAKRSDQEQKKTLTPTLSKTGDVKAKAPEAPIKKRESEKTKVIQEGSLTERVRRRAEEERAKAAMVEEAEREKKTSCGAWKERVAGELQELAEMKWADGLAEMARNNKEVLATAIAAFSLGFLVSQKLFSR